MIKSVAITLAFIAVAANSLSGADILDQRELIMRELQEMHEDAMKNCILNYDCRYDGDALIKEVQSACSHQCEVEHLKSICDLILHFPSDNHMPCDSFLSIEGITEATDDDVIRADPDIPSDPYEELQPLLGLRKTGSLYDPDDQKWLQQWELHDDGVATPNADINWQAGRAKWEPTADVVVAVVDTGIDHTHPDLKDAMWTNPGEIPGDGIDNDGNGKVDDVHGASFVKNEASSMDYNGHGTHCAGVIAASTGNSIGMAGMAGVEGSSGTVKLMAVKGLGSSGSGEFSGLLAGVNYAINMGAKISSNSWGGMANSAGMKFIQNLRRSLESKKDRHLFVAAAANDNRVIGNYPYGSPYIPASANAANQITVGSTTRWNTRSSFSNVGKEYVHVFAPGSDIMSTYPVALGSYKQLSGTSMACPHVSGLAAMLMSVRGDLTPLRAKELILENVQKPNPNYQQWVSSAGLIDVEKTLKALTALMPTRPTRTTIPPNTSTKAPKKCTYWDWIFGICAGPPTW